MQQFRKTIDELPLVVKIILALPVLDIIWAIYRICRGDTPAIILGVIWILVGGWTILWVVDVIFLAMGKNVWELSDKDVSQIKNFVNQEEPVTPTEEVQEDKKEEN